MTERTILLAGGGNMGNALLRAWRAKLENLRIFVVEPGEMQAKRARELGAHIFTDITSFTTKLGSDFVPQAILFAVKPQILGKVAEDYRQFADRGSLFISIAAGISCDILKKWLGPSAPVVRTIPNTPAAIGAGTTAAFSTPDLSAEHKSFCTELMSAAGALLWVDDERLIDVATAVSGSGPAFLFYFIECLSAAAEQLGFDDDPARQLAVETVLGAARYAAENREEIAKLREQVTSPGGTTAAGLEILMHSSALKPLIQRTVSAAHRRAQELGMKDETFKT